MALDKTLNMRMFNGPLWLKEYKLLIWNKIVLLEYVQVFVAQNIVFMPVCFCFCYFYYFFFFFTVFIIFFFFLTIINKLISNFRKFWDLFKRLFFVENFSFLIILNELIKFLKKLITPLISLSLSYFIFK